MPIPLETTLRHLALVTWTVEPERLAALLPQGIVPRTIETDHGRRALFSLAGMIQFGLSPRYFSSLAFSFPQINERAYVSRPDGSHPGVFFFRSEIDSRVAFVPHRLLGLPYYRARVAIELEEGRLTVRRGTDVLAEIDLAASERTTKEDAKILDATSNPMIGYSLVRGRRLASFCVEHEAIEPNRVRVVRAEARALETGYALGLHSAPAVAAYVPESRFVIRIPPEMLT
jgi:hypothetical protein